MKCAVAIVLAIIGMTLANPIPPLGLTSLAGPPLALPAVVTSSVINHGVSLPHVVVPSIPIIKAPVVLATSWGLKWRKHWH